MNEPYLPWATGPGEILRHGLELLQRDSDVSRRLAMISIDNAVELMISTFLGLPKRVTGIAIPRKQFQEISESFPALLDALENYAPEKLDGIDLGTIEWHHRLRNQLYHQGNGLTVEREKVEVYAQLANLLFKNLFGYELVHSRSKPANLLGEFMEQWVTFESALRDLASTHSLTGEVPPSIIDVLKFLEDAALLSPQEKRELDHFRRLRNEVVHGAADYRQVITEDVVARLRQLIKKIAPDESD
jgi:hypothetical protein